MAFIARVSVRLPYKAKYGYGSGEVPLTLRRLIHLRRGFRLMMYQIHLPILTTAPKMVIDVFKDPDLAEKIIISIVVNMPRHEAKNIPSLKFPSVAQPIAMKTTVNNSPIQYFLKKYSIIFIIIEV